MPARKRTDQADDLTNEQAGLAAEIEADATRVEGDATRAEGDATKVEPDATGLTANQSAELTVEFLGAPVSLDMTAAPEYVRQSAPVRARSTAQQAMDTTVSQLREAWIKAGRPGSWAGMVAGKCVGYYFVEPTQVGSLKKKINRSKLFLELSIKWGSDFVCTEEMRTRFNLPEHYVGRTVVSFAAKDKRPRNLAQAGVTSTAAVLNDDDDDDDDEDDDE